MKLPLTKIIHWSWSFLEMPLHFSLWSLSFSLVGFPLDDLLWDIFVNEIKEIEMAGKIKYPFSSEEKSREIRWFQDVCAHVECKWTTSITASEPAKIWKSKADEKTTNHKTCSDFTLQHYLVCIKSRCISSITAEPTIW